MTPPCLIIISFLLLAIVSCKGNEEYLLQVREAAVNSMNWAQASLTVNQIGKNADSSYSALGDCVELYENSDYRLARLLVSEHDVNDKITWFSGVLNDHRSCLDGPREEGLSVPQEAKDLTVLIPQALREYGCLQRPGKQGDITQSPSSKLYTGLLASWNANTTTADYVVAQDRSGNYKTINEAMREVAQRGRNQHDRVVIHIKSGIYTENIQIKRDMRNIMFVGDGIDRTIVRGDRNVKNGGTTYNSATVIVSGDGFWARDMTFENTAGPENHQVVAITVASDHSVFYRCSFKGYQNTLFVHSHRQFYRDCHVYGTVDFIFGDAAAVLQNCDIFVRKPMNHQANMITAQGRDDQHTNTGISIHMSRIAPTSDLQTVKESFKTFLGRPWKKYSRTVIMKTDLDGFIHPKGWREWSGNFALSTLFYGEYMNSGNGASTGQRVNWPGFHVLHDARQAEQFTVNSFIQGETGIPVTGVPFSGGL